MSSVVQPLWLKHEDVPVLPDGWCVMRTDEACVQLKPGKLYDQKTVSEAGEVPVINQSENGFHGYHSNDPGVNASFNFPVVTFANHTCAMRVVRQPFSMIQNVFPKVGKPGVTDTVYFYYASIGRVNLSDYKGHHPLFRMMYIPIPPLQTQRKIVAILSAYDDLIENNLRRIKILEEMAQNLYREWFVKFRFPGYEKVKFVDSPLGTIPEGWDISTIENAFEITGGGTPSKKEAAFWDAGTVNWYSPTDLTATNSMFIESSRYKITNLGLKKSSARLFPAFSVMMTSRATLGVISINTTDACTNQGFITCLPNDRVPLYFLYHWLSNNVEMFTSLATGAIFKEITKGVFKKIELAIPPSTLITQFEEAVRPLGETNLNLLRRNILLRKTRDLLLPKLVSGEVDASDLDIKIPEEVIE